MCWGIWSNACRLDHKDTSLGPFPCTGLQVRSCPARQLHANLEKREPECAPFSQFKPVGSRNYTLSQALPQRYYSNARD
jgi:hypothetical protein